MTALLCLARGIEPRPGRSEYLVDLSRIDWPALRGHSVRIIFEHERDLRPLLKAACAHDCSIDVLDANNVDYAIVSYDTSDHRKVKRKLGMPIFEPLLLHMPPLYAAGLLREYRCECHEAA